MFLQEPLSEKLTPGANPTGYIFGKHDVFVCAMFLAGCDDKPQSEGSSKTGNTINSTVNQSSEKSSGNPSDDELLKYTKERDAEAAESWKKALKTDRLENRTRETGVF